jgi:hypothetical protein
MSDEVWTFEPSDPGRLNPLLDGLAHPEADGFPVHICPEPTTEKARFGRTKEIDSGYGVDLFQMGRPDPQIVLQLSAPNGDGLELIRSAGEHPPEGWADDPSMPGILACSGEPHPTTGRWIVAALAAMGATFPTGRVRVSDPGVVEHFNRSS